MLRRLSRLLRTHSMDEIPSVFREKLEVKRLSRMQRYQDGATDLLGKTLFFPDALSFLWTYQEIFKREIYKFSASNSSPRILDLGANIGLSIIYFKKIYPSAKITAFEPDEKIFEFMKRNLISFGIEDVELIRKAVWKEETILSFFAEGADGGRLAISGERDRLLDVETIRLRDFLKEKIDFLKIDIEGAEHEVIEDCADLLSNVENIFIEYHSFSNKPQNLHWILATLSANGFRYHLQHLGHSPNPFLEVYTNLGMDCQINIFAAKKMNFKKYSFSTRI